MQNPLMSHLSEGVLAPSQSDFVSLDFEDDIDLLSSTASSVLSLKERSGEANSRQLPSPFTRVQRDQNTSKEDTLTSHTSLPLHGSDPGNVSGQVQASSAMRSPNAVDPKFSSHMADNNERATAASRDDLCDFYSERSPSCGAVGEDANRSSDHPLDITWLSDRCDGDVHLLVAVLETFCEQGKSHCSAMERALAEKDLQKLCFHTDFIVGSARNVGARQLEQRAESLANGLRACLEHGGCPDMLQSLEKQVTDVTMCFLEVSTFWQIGVQSAQGGSVHPLEQMDGNADGRGYVWPTSLPSNFRLSMVQLQDYLKSVKDEIHSDNASARSFEDEEDEATEPGQSIEGDASAAGSRTDAGSRTQSNMGGVGARVTQTSAVSSDRESSEERAHEVNMNAVFHSVRVRLERMRRSNGLGQVQTVKEEAQAILQIASSCGSRGIAGKAEGIANSSAQYVLSGVLDELELQVDSAEAIWKSSGWII